MKKLFLSATAIATVMSASALAADLPSIKSATAAPAPLWTGFYAGMNAGYAFGLTDGARNYGWANPYSFTLFDEITSLNSAASFTLASSYPGRGISQGGFIGGGQVGYNYQYGQKIVLGFETDIQGAGIRGTGNANGYGPFTDSVNSTGNSAYSANGYINNNIVQAGIDWLGTVRGRIGYLVTPSFQIYGTGGLAYGSAFLNTRTNSAFGGENRDLAGAVSSSWILFGSDTSYASKTQLLSGYTAGAGGEWMVTPSWSIKAEALYYNLGTQSVSNYLYSYGYSPGGLSPGGTPTFSAGSTTQARYDGVIGRAGVNYHFNWNAPADGTAAIATELPSLKSPAASTLALSWTGLYAGLNAGYAFGVTQGAENYGWANPSVLGPNPLDAAFAIASSAPGQGINQGGFIGGGQVGYNHQYGQKIVFGFEADMQGAGIRGKGNANGIGPWADGTSGAFINNNIIQAGIDWLGTARGRMGYLITPTFQLYGTGGLAYGNAFLNTFTNSSFVDGAGYANGSAWILYGLTTSYASKSQLLVGYSAGGGGEWMLSNTWSVKAEAIYYNLGTQSVENTYYNADPATLLAGSTTRARYDGVIGRAGINYHFDFGRAIPVIARF